MSIRRLLAPFLALWLAAMIGPTAALAAPAAYDLDAAQSEVGFTYRFSGAPTEGTMPVASAEMTLDFDRIANSRVNVTLDPSRARAGFAFATQAMKGASVLDTANHPRITFRSTAVRGTLSDARVEGLLTVRGVTRPVTLSAGLFRQRGTEAGDLSRVSVLLTGTISRAEFGATGWPEFVADPIALRIVARLDKRAP